MEGVSIIGVDLAKNVFQLHGAAADGGSCPARLCRDCILRGSWRTIPDPTPNVGPPEGRVFRL